MEASWRDGMCIDSGTSHCHDAGVPNDERYSLTELADLAGVTPRTVRYYLAQGLLPAIGPSGPGSRYDTGHLARLRLIRRLQTEHLPLAEIRRRLDDLDEDQIRDLAGEDAAPPPSDSALEYLRTVLTSPASTRVAESVSRPYASMPAPSAPAVPTQPSERSQWERIVLAPDIELHIRRPLQRAQTKQVDRLVTIARELLEEDRP
jgi:DNA-binding transcriptional MerR regulator